ncbi:Rha family phage regulatory protein [Paenibacillus shirakamiensis]|uniref:Rha family phage regulatory protein n=1 Tax=Paenibacillus shirakamiensis TaxID=1265935 RepID=A0ABS4JDC0_9BACL|nr:Rha family transcriptional regulator [Paenibacillus shirakamiensis]MBP1999719.1 Rha family phage regulatory protein [Paenibacillus shirakamiensis]
MKQLQVISQNGQLLVDSREVAEMISIRHSDLLERIGGYIKHLTNGDFRSSDFFIGTTYLDAKNEARPHYLVTRKGCDMVANKMTGEKGVLFTAAYVTKFEEMEKSHAVDLTGLSPQLQLMIQMERRQVQIEQRQQQTEHQLTTIKETFLQRDDNWRQKINGMLNGAARKSGTSFKDIRTESYNLLELRGKCDLNRRLANLRERLADSGATKTKINETNRMDVIESEPRLKEIYTTIVKELAIGSLA